MGQAARPPLAVDLDGTLIRGDLFSEAMLRLAFAKPWRLPLLLAWLWRGRAYAKAKLAVAFPADAAALPYDERVVAWLREQRAAGREIALATASDQRAAQAVADHVGLFDRVFASDGRVNLKSRRKSEALAAAYPDGFVYAGNERADMKVWGAASHAVLCNCSPGLARRAGARFKIERVFDAEGSAARSLLTAMRPRHWAKNLLVFVPMLTGQGWFDLDAWRAASIAFAALCLVASSVYLVNDVADIDADRRHPRKRMRPFASGAVSPVAGLALALVLLSGGLALGALSGAGWLIAAYAIAASLYTFALKRIVLLDVVVLAALYGLRIVIGGDAAGYAASDWLLAFSGFFFLSLALVKRAAEVDALRGDLIGRGYRGGDGPVLKRFGAAVGVVSAVVLALYLQEPANAARYSAPLFLWALPAAVLFWLARLWLKVERREMHDDPLLFALRDPASWATFAVTAAAFAAAALV
ncbi:MAG: UbiA family prenyltransferase [Phycisphaerales bacterium]|nr:UbiA family prenyltransferase [Hyphomonadaceae bacterium]